MKTIPSGMAVYKRTAEFAKDTVPAALLREHCITDDVWAKLVVLYGAITYRILEPDVEETVLLHGQCGVIEPNVLHEVVPHEEVCFFLEFYRAETL